MDGTPSRPRPVATAPAGAAQRRQAEVDADEHEVEARYQRRQEFGALVADAVRRAEALTRLERVLDTP